MAAKKQAKIAEMTDYELALMAYNWTLEEAAGAKLSKEEKDYVGRLKREIVERFIYGQLEEDFRLAEAAEAAEMETLQPAT